MSPRRRAFLAGALAVVVLGVLALALVPRLASDPADTAAGLLSHMTTLLDRNLTSEQRMPTLAWVRRREADTSVLVQVGANSHRKNAADPDPGPLCVKLGWRSVLLEPIPNIFGELRHKDMLLVFLPAIGFQAEATLQFA